MQVVIQKVGNSINFVGEMIGKVYETSVCDSDDTMRILAELLDVIASKDDACVYFINN